MNTCVTIPDWLRQSNTLCCFVINVKSWQIIEANQTAAHLLGTNQIPVQLLQILQPNSEQVIAELEQILIKGQGVIQLKIQGAPATNWEVLFTSNQQIVLITEAGQLQDAEDYDIEIFNAFLKYVPVNKWVTDESGKLIMTNDYYNASINLKQSPVGKSIWDLFDKKTADEYHRNNLEVIALNKPIQKLESYIDAEGENRTLRVIKYPIQLKNGKTVVGSVSVDISEELHRKAALKNKIKEVLKLTQIADNTINGVVLTDKEGKIEWVNQSFEKITGYTLKEVIGKKPGDILQGPNTDKETVKRMSHAIKNGQPFHEEILNYHKSGRTYWIDMLNQPTYDANGDHTGFVALALDITEEKRKKSILQEAEERIRLILNATQDGIWEHNYLTGQSFASDQLIDMVNLNPKENISIENWKKIVHPDDLKKMEDFYEDVFKNKIKSGSLEFRIQFKGGGYGYIRESFVCDFNENGALCRMIGAVKDITKEKNQEQALAYQAKLLGSVQQILIAMNPEGRVTFWNKYAEEYWNKPAKEAIGQKIEEIIVFTHQTLEERLLERRKLVDIVKQNKVYHREIRVLNAKGEERVMSGDYFPVFNEHHELTDIVIVANDITETKKIEAEVNYLARLLESVQQVVIAVDLNWNVTYWNKYAEIASGYTEEEAIGKPIEQVVHITTFTQEEKAKQRKWIEGKLLAKEKVVLELKGVSKQGEERFTRAEYFPVFSDDQQLISIIIIATDITESKRANEQIQYQASILNSVQQVVIATDLQGKINYINKYAIEKYKISEEEYVGKSVTEVMKIYGFTDEEREQKRNEINEILKKGDSFSSELKVQLKNQIDLDVKLNYFPIFNETKSLIGRIIVAEDIGKEKKIREELQYHSLLLDSVQQCVVSTDLDGKVLYWNKYAEKLFGVPKNQALGKSVEQLVQITSLSQRERLNKRKEIHEALKSGTGKSLEVTALGKNGEVFIKIDNFPILNEKKELTGVITISQDITQEKIARDQINFQAWLLDNVQQAVIAVNTRGEVQYWNKYAELLYGFKFLEIKNQKLSKFLRVNDLDWQKSKLAFSLMSSGQNWEGEVELKTNKGIAREVHISGSPVYGTNGQLAGFLSVSHDISESKKAISQIRFQSELLSRVQQAIIARKLDGTVIYWNEYAEAYLGVSAKDAIGRNVKELYKVAGVDDEQREQFWAEGYKKMQTPEGWTREATLVTLNNISIPTQAIGSPLYDNNGELYGVIMVLQDITERIKAEQAVKQSLQRLESFVTHMPAGAVLLYEDKMLVNRQALKLLEYEEEELNTKEKWFENLYKEKWQEKFRLYQEHRAKGFPGKIDEITTKSGKKIWLKFDGFLDDQLEIWIITEITDLIVSQKAIQLQNLELKRIAQIQSHTVRRPLANILGLASILDFYKDGLSKELIEIIDNIIESSKQLDQVITEIVQRANKVIQ